MLTHFSYPILRFKPLRMSVRMSRRERKKCKHDEKEVETKKKQ